LSGRRKWAVLTWEPTPLARKKSKLSLKNHRNKKKPGIKLLQLQLVSSHLTHMVRNKHSLRRQEAKLKIQQGE